MMDLEYLKTILCYDDISGQWIWIVNRRGYRGIKAGDLAGSINGHGYRQIRIDGKIYKSSRLAWFYMTGKWPMNEIDHINHIRSDDRFENLREATRKQNACNKDGYGKSLKWVNKRGNRYESRITRNGKQKYLGTYDTAQEAYCVAKNFSSMEMV